MKNIQTVLFLAFFYCSVVPLQGQITVDDTQTASDLVSLLTQGSSCISFSNPTVKGDALTPSKNSYGSFNRNGTSFPFAEGIILSSGNADNAVGPFIPLGKGGEGNFAWPGDADLNSILGITSYNATILEFDFISQTNFISFNYIFASNEYQLYYPCDYSDGFAFLIKENSPGAAYQNLAVIPNSSTAVSSENIRPKINDMTVNGVSYPGCPAINETYFNGFNPISSPVNFAGQTIVMKAQTALDAGKSYHIKLVLADSEISDKNSAVFIESGSFSPKIDLGSDRLLATENPICDGANLILDTKLQPPNTFQWFKDGSLTPIPFETNPTFTATEAGTYKVEVDISTGCITEGEIKIEFAPPLVLNPSPLSKCDDNGSGTARFDLTLAETEIKKNDSNWTKVDFYETQTGTLLSDPILNPKDYTKTTTLDQTLYLEATSKYQCTLISPLTLTTLPSLPTTGLGTPPKVNDFLGNDNSIELIPPSTAGSYEYSLDGLNYQVSNVFSGLPIGQYTAYIRDQKTCNFSIIPEVNVLDYPLFFTPNQDGINDNWSIENLDQFPKAIVSIFDRYGKLLSQIGTLNYSWNGKFKNTDMPSDDYWFSIDFGDGKIVKGHFTLKR